MPRFTFIDLFAGIGGFRMGLSNNGGKCVAFSEIDRTAIKTYCLNYNEPEELNLGDITTIKSLPTHDLLTAGVPCQSWSIAGKNLGFDDDRGQLWNDTLFLLNKSRPKAFIFENVKGLIDPRNKKALGYILSRIWDAGYYAKAFLINSADYGIPQNRVRVYIIGFQEEKYMQKFLLPKRVEHNHKLFDFLDLPATINNKEKLDPWDLFGKTIPTHRTRFQKKDELNDFFLFNDIRNGHSTIHSWDIIETSEREKEICLLLLGNRRKKIFGPYDGNPLSIGQLRKIDSTISENEIQALVAKGILKKVEYSFHLKEVDYTTLDRSEQIILDHLDGSELRLDDIKNSRKIKQAKFSFKKALNQLVAKGILECVDIRYDFKYSKISSGINGINRIYLPISDVFSTLVASDTNDFVATLNVTGISAKDFKENFLKEVFERKAYRKITKEEACIIQGYPEDFVLPQRRDQWMKLLGNSVSVPVIDKLCESIVETGVFNDNEQTNIVDYSPIAELEMGEMSM
jgi:DNA (cytosine-5)-methyltransferase 1